MPGMTWPTYADQAEELSRRADEAAWEGDLEKASRLDAMAATYRERGDQVEVPF